MYREEKDSIGKKEVPESAYYGVQSLRGYENFRITGLSVEECFIKNLAIVKKACAIANNKAECLDEKLTNATIQACNEIIEGHFLKEFIIDPIQGGAGTSMNMNINEMIANRANEILGYEKGKYYPIHPNDHINMGQSTNDVIPTAGSITAYLMISDCLRELDRLEKAFLNKGEELKQYIKMGRTEMQDAVPVSLGQEFTAYGRAIHRDIERIKATAESLLHLNLGGTAIGTGITADASYIRTVVPELKELMGLELTQCEDLIDGTQNLDKFVDVSAALKTCAVNIGKISGDLILMSSGPRTGFGEIMLPSKQNGSSIMPGKVNPVMPEVMKQIVFQIIGNDLTISMSAEGGQLELNAFCPVIFFNLFQSIKMLTNGVNTFVNNCVEGIEGNEGVCTELVDKSIGIVTALAPILGYEKTSEIAKKALRTKKYVKDVIMEETNLSEEEVNKILDAKDMISVS